MVWFQCEDCGDNLKKPKLPNHFRTCSATKLSCIDCGQTFGQESVQGHTQCITEAEKYGPKGQGAAMSVTTPKSNKDSKQQPDFDILVGLSERPPWFCSLCNTKATSKQTLLLHAEGKKHKAKARGFHAAKKQSNQTEETVPDQKPTAVDTPKCEGAENGHVGAEKSQDQLEAKSELGKLEEENGASHTKKKRKRDAVDGASTEKTRDDDPSRGNGEVIQATKAEIEPIKDEAIASKPLKEDLKMKIKWKKLITSILKSNPDGVLKLSKLRKLTLKSIRESGVTEDETKLIGMLEQKINSSSKFAVEKKYVRLAAKA
ncbi:UBP1-associated proteins 1C [Cucumis melo var. makuwa]|uniref:UBP1-associated proteins 1C n=2 Tax=Cucumis melo TaxID=3656 RepID=A0A5D3CK37_CUCMM|nr:UBP1-associated proteins 1C [Cucumis melo]TYK10796.1 UBP1-associated proteins 1C [Cucumis melo var. makuwa]